MRQRRAENRRALTLLEVVVSMFIFLISVTALWQLVSVGTDRAMDVSLQSATSLKCQSKMAEVMIGAQPPMDVAEQAYDEPDQQFRWSMKASPAGLGLYEVRIWVTTTTPSGRVIESFLSQLVLEPTMRGSTQDRPPPPEPPTPTVDAPTK